MANAIRKRIALALATALGASTLVAVAAAPAQATARGLSTDFNQVTVVSANYAGRAVFRVTVSDADGKAKSGLSAGETLTVRVTGVPTGETETAAIEFSPLKSDFSTADTDLDDTPSVLGGAINVADVTTDTATVSLNSASTTTFGYLLGVETSTAWSGVEGYYTFVLELQTVGGVIRASRTLTVGFFNAITDVTPKVTVGGTARAVAGQKFPFGVASSTNRMTVTVRDANDGALRSTNLTTIPPVVELTNADTTTVVSVSATDVRDANGATHGDAATDDGIFSLDVATIPAGFDGSSTITAFVGNSRGTGTVSIFEARVSGSSGKSVVGWAGAGLVDSSTVDAIAPLTTTRITLNILARDNGANPAVVAGATLVVTPTHTSAGRLSPNTAQTVVTDSEGKASVTFTVTAPANADVLAVTITGDVSHAFSTTYRVYWQAPVATTVTIDPGNKDTIGAALKSTNTFTATVLDQFDAVIANQAVGFSVAGANAPAAGTTIPSKVTDAKGQVTYTITDAAAKAADTDALTVTAGSASSTVTIKYAATAPTVSSLSAFYFLGADATPTAAEVAVAFPTTTLRAADPININTQADITKSLLTQASIVTLRFDGNAEGAPVTLTAGKGGHILNSAGLPQASLTDYTDKDGDAFFWVFATGTGDITYTATSGTASRVVTIAYENAYKADDAGADAGDQKIVRIAVSGNVATATVTDNFGNPVEDVPVTFSRTGTVTINGGTSAEIKTNASGVAEVILVGTGSVAASIASGQTEWIAGFNGETELDGRNAAAVAGVGSASITVTGAQSATEAAASAAQAAATANTAAIARVQEQVTALAASVTSLIAALSAQVKRLQTALTNVRRLIRSL